jgi:hypothetical protein
MINSIMMDEAQPYTWPTLFSTSRLPPFSQPGCLGTKGIHTMSQQLVYWIHSYNWLVRFVTPMAVLLTFCFFFSSFLWHRNVLCAIVNDVTPKKRPKQDFQHATRNQLLFNFDTAPIHITCRTKSVGEGPPGYSLEPPLLIIGDTHDSALSQRRRWLSGVGRYLHPCTGPLTTRTIPYITLMKPTMSSLPCTIKLRHYTLFHYFCCTIIWMNEIA